MYEKDHNVFVISFGGGGGTLAEHFNKNLFKLPKERILQFHTNAADGRDHTNPIGLTDGGTSSVIGEVVPHMEKFMPVITDILSKKGLANQQEADPQKKVIFFASCGGTGSAGAKVVIPWLIEQGIKVELNFISPFENDRMYKGNELRLFDAAAHGLIKYTRAKNMKDRLTVFILSNQQVSQRLVSYSKLTQDQSRNLDTLNEEMLSVYKDIMLFHPTHTSSESRGKPQYDAAQHRALIERGGGIIAYIRKRVKIDVPLEDADKHQLHDLNICKTTTAGDLSTILCLPSFNDPKVIAQGEQFLISATNYINNLNNKAASRYGIAKSTDGHAWLYVIGAQCNLDTFLSRSETIAVNQAVRRQSHKDRGFVTDEVNDILDTM